MVSYIEYLRFINILTEGICSKFSINIMSRRDVVNERHTDYDVVILAYPDSLESVQEEVTNVSNELHTLSLVNPTDTEIYDKIRGISKVNGFWIAAHIGLDGVYRNNSGDLAMSISTLLVYLRILKPKWVLLNGCNSSDVLIELQAQIDVDIIVPYQQNLDDNYAMKMASLLALEYSRSGSIIKSVLKLSPTGKVFQYYRSPFAENLSNDELNVLMHRVEDISKLLEGDVVYQRVGLLEAWDTMEKLLQQLSVDFQNFKQEFAAKFLLLSIGMSILSLFFIINLIIGIMLLWTL